MNYSERLEALKGIELAMEDAHKAYFETEAQLVEVINEYLKGKEVKSAYHGVGTVTESNGETLSTIIIDVAFANETRRFSLGTLMTYVNIVKFTDPEVKETWEQALAVHTKLTNAYEAVKDTERHMALEAAKKAEEAKRAEFRYDRIKAKAIKDFETLTAKASSLSAEDEFYYALGWMAKHIGSISAVLPDYLESSFTKHFGTETSARIVDSKKRTVNGNSMQWTFGFKATLRKAENIPVILNQYLSTTGKAIANTSFVWDLIDNYGFQFGKEQNEKAIADHIPVEFLSSFEAGLMA